MRLVAALAAAAVVSHGVAVIAPVSALAQVAATVQLAVRAAGSPAGLPRGAAGPTPTVPLAGASVSVRESGVAVVTDAGGLAVLRGLSPGRHTLLVSALGFAEAAVEVEAVNGRVARASLVLDPLPIRIRGLDVRAPPGAGAARGTVVETASLPPGVTDLPAALERVPGATVVRQGGPGASATVQLRGADGDQVLVLLDGTPINSPVSGVADLSTVELESVGRITVIPGAQSARYGPRALGGVVLLESRAARARSGAVTAGAGAWSTVETAAHASRGLGAAWSVSGGARWRRSDGTFTYDVPAFRGGGRKARENAAFTQAGGNVQVRRQGRVDASLRAQMSDLERGSPGAIAQPSLSGRQHHRRWAVSGQLEAGRPALGGTARTALHWQRAEYADASPPFGRAYETRTRVRRAEFALEGWWSPAAPALRVGLQGARLDVESNGLARPVVQLNEFGAWARLSQGWTLGRAVGLEIGSGIRADVHDLVDGVLASPAIDLTLSRAGVALDLAWRLGFSPPGLGDLFFQEGVLVEPNPDLRPERIRGERSASLSRSWSLGALGGQLRGTVYRADLDDMILWFPDHRFVWSPDNYDVSRRGLELDAIAELSVFGATHSLRTGGAWSEVEYAGGVLAGQVAYRPRFTADLALNLGLPAGVTLAPAATRVGRRRTVPGSALNRLDAYTLFDVGIAIPLVLGSVPGRLDLALTNLLDERATLLVDYPLPGRGWSTRLRIGALR